MAKSQKPRKARRSNPPPVAGACYLFYWVGANLPTGTFGFGSTAPITRADQQRLLRRAMNRPTQWIVIVSACFLNAATRHYHEVFDTLTTQPVRLAHDDSQLAAENPERISTELLEEDIQALISATRSGEDEADYLDTMVTLRPATPTFQRLVDDGDWWQAQTAHREKQFRQRLGEQVDRLAAMVGGH